MTTAGVVGTAPDQERGNGFVTKLSPTGAALAYSTFLGGAGDYDIARAVAVHASGRATVVGPTGGSGFPTTPGAYATSFNGTEDAFAVRLDPTATSFVYATYLGGTGTDGANDVAVDSAGAAYVVGTTNSTGLVGSQA